MANFFWLTRNDDHAGSPGWRLRELKESHLVLGDKREAILVFIDPSSLPTIPGWPLRNALFWLGKRHQLKTIRVLCYRESPMEDGIPFSLLLDIVLPEISGRRSNRWRSGGFVY
jgi:hypothetical protein